MPRYMYVCVKDIQYLFVFSYMLRLIKKEEEKAKKKIVHKNNIDIHLSVDVCVCVFVCVKSYIMVPERQLLLH